MVANRYRGLWLNCALAVALPAAAHHSFAAYDQTRAITLNGIAKNIQWDNPHVIIRVWVPVAGSNVAQEWSLVTSNPGILKHLGWTQRSINPGDRIRVLCQPKRNGTYSGRLITLFELDSGKTLDTKLSAAAH
ncbi:MAG: DUF6152 family protein [Steroidobacteraceae bacterium]